jgi:hypothetical protein
MLRNPPREAKLAKMTVPNEREKEQADKGCTSHIAHQPWIPPTHPNLGIAIPSDYCHCPSTALILERTRGENGAERHPAQDSPTKRVAMVNDDVVKCPLCGGLTHIEKTDLREALKNPRLREQVEM